MIVNHDRKVIFVSVPKTASTSINIAFDIHAHSSPKIHHSSIKEILENHPECSSYFKFGFVRNPWDRMVSCYLNGVQDLSHRDEWSKGLLEYENFCDFVCHFERSIWKDWIHFLPLSHFLKIDGEIAVDVIGRFENLVEDFGSIKSKIGLTKGLAHSRKSKRENNYKEYYNDHTRDIIENFYKEDIETFGYEF